MDTVSRLKRDADSAYRGGRLREAVLLFRQAAVEAEMLGNRAAWFENLVWAAISASHVDDFPLALRLLFEARAGEPPDRPDYEAMLARKRQFHITFSYRPLLPRMLEQLDELREFAREFPVPQADIEYISSTIAWARGQTKLAREGYERAWQVDVHTKGGYIKEIHAAANITCCLEMGDASGARQWIAGLEGVVSDFDHFRKAEASKQRIYLALLEAASSQELRERLRVFDDSVIDASQWEAECLFVRVRVHLLEPDGGDPAERAHPARQALTRHRFPARWDIHHRFSRQLLLLDYRLAVLRYATGVTPVDDYFYSNAQTIPIPLVVVVPEDDLVERIRKARTAANLALAFAQKLDGWLECDSRQKAVEARRERIEEIVRVWNT